MHGDMPIRLVEGLERNGLLLEDCLKDLSFRDLAEAVIDSESVVSDTGRKGHIFTGHIGSESFLCAVVTVVQKLKDLNKKFWYVCDPVLGDLGKFYVPKQLVDIYYI